jgi:predicted 3-demethylubiquinone-9 3-methyltransferase (glyoxalase superfamily)
MSKMLPSLMFQGGHAETTMSLYVSLFEDGKILDVTRRQKGEAGAEGSIKLARFRAAGQGVMASESPVKHAFDFTPSWFFFVERKSGEEQERLFAELSNDEVLLLLLLAGYGFSKRFGWVADRFGVSWQLDLA